MAAVFLASAFLGVVTVGSQPTRAAAPFRIFTIGDPRLSVATLNPMTITSVEEYIITYNVYSTLVTYDKNYNLKGDLAYKWDPPSTDNVTWTFHLVTSAVFVNPTNPSDTSHPVTAADVVFSYDMQKNLTGSIFNVYALNFKTVTALDPYTVQIVTEGPFAAMYGAIAGIPIFPTYIWSQIKTNLLLNRNTNGGVVGSGAMYYDITNTSFGTNIILRRNPHYYGATVYCQFSRPDEVYFKGYTSSASMVADFMAGTSGLDTIINVGPSDYLHALPAVSDPNGIQKWAVDSGFVSEFNVNVMTQALRDSNSQFKNGYNNPLLLNQTVRWALAKSVDKSAIVQYALLGLGREADSVVPSANPWHYSIPDALKFKFDPQAARAMLNAAGWTYNAAGTNDPAATPLYRAPLPGMTNGSSPLTFRFYVVNTYQAFEQAAKNITVWLAQAGIQTTDSRGNPGYQVYTYNQMVGIWFSADYDLWIWDWIFSPVSEVSLDILSVETTQAIGPTSDNYFSNATYDNDYNLSLTTVNQTARRVITDRMQQQVYSYASYILPYYAYSLYAAANGRPGTNPAAGWTGYGDWTQALALTPDSDLPDLWFQISPLDNRAPAILSFPSVEGFTGVATQISVTAADPEAQALSYNFDFGDGSPVVSTASSTVSHTYANAGTYQVSVRAADSEWPVCSSAKATILPYTPGPGQNLPPVASLSLGLSHNTYAYVGQNVYFNLSANDTEGDPIYAHWDFGDGSGTAKYVTNTKTTQVMQVVHAYSSQGTYTAWINYSDNKTGLGTHTKSINATVDIRTAPGGGTTAPESNPWINYGVPLAVLAAIIIATVAVLVRRRSRTKKEQIEEGAGPPQGPQPPPPP